MKFQDRQRYTEKPRIKNKQTRSRKKKKFFSPELYTQQKVDLSLSSPFPLSNLPKPVFPKVCSEAAST